MIDELPPQSLEMEQAALGAMLIDATAVVRTRNIVRPAHFYREAHRVIFEAMLALADQRQPVDILTVQEQLRDRGVLEDVGGTAYLILLTEAPASAANAAYYAERIRAAAGRRYSLAAMHTACVDLYNPDVDPRLTIARLQTQLARAQEGLATAHRAYSMRELMSAAYDLLDGKAQSETIEVGLRCIDGTTGGLAPGTVCLLAARPGIGKTALAMNAAVMTAEKGTPVVFASVEMDPALLAMRTVCARAGVSFHQAVRGRLGQRDCADMAEPMASLSSIPLTILDAARMTPNDIEVHLRKHKAGFGVVDYMQLLSPVVPDARSREREVASISRALKGIARELRIPLLVLTQLNRSVEGRDDREPELHDLRESGSQEQDADVVVMLWRTSRHVEGESSYPLGIKVGKNRYGGTSRQTVTFTPRKLTFEEGTQ